jgi:hypothetical protein
MAGKAPRPQATQERRLTAVLTQCPDCGHRRWWGYTNDKVVPWKGWCGYGGRTGAVPTRTAAGTTGPTALKRKAGSACPLRSMGWMGWPCSVPCASRGMGVCRSSTGEGWSGA